MDAFRSGVLLAASLVAVAATARAGPFQGPVSGVVETADGAAFDDLVVELRCHGYGIHGTHRSDTKSQVVATGAKFRFLWAWRGIAPASCWLYVYHPHYSLGYHRLSGDFTEDVGTLVLESWDAFLDAGPTEPDVNRSSPWPTIQFFQYLSNLQYYYIPAFPEAERPDLARYVPHIHHLFRRVIATGAYGGNERHSRNSPMDRIRAIEDTLGFAGSQTALFAAVDVDDPERIREVVAAGAWLDTWDVKGYSPLLRAVRDGKLAAARTLIELGADPHLRIHARAPSMLQVALREGHREIVAMLLENGVVLDREEIPPDDLASLMRSAAWSGDADSLRTFLEAGIEPDLTRSNGVTALMDAAKENQLEIARILIAAGADVNACAADNRYALKMARGERHTEMVALLSRAGAVEATPNFCEFSPSELHRTWWIRKNAERRAAEADAR